MKIQNPAEEYWDIRKKNLMLEANIHELENKKAPIDAQINEVLPKINYLQQ